MLIIDTLAKNKNIFNPDKEQQDISFGIWDLTRSSISYKNVDVRFKKYLVTKEDYQMRPDLMAYQIYGDMAYTGSLLKVNSVSNPFSIDLGEVFAAPTSKSIEDMFSTKATLLGKDNTSDNPNTKFRNSQEQRKFRVSNSRKEFLEKRLKAKNPPPQILPPNLMQEGERQTVRTNSVIGLAPDVSNASPNQNANI